MTYQVASASTTTPNSGGDANTTATSQPVVTSTAPVTGGDATTTTQQDSSVTSPASTTDATNPQSTPKVTDSTDDKSSDNVTPDTYEFKVPEGAKLPDAVMDELSLVARELGLSQESAQKLVDKLSPAIANETAQQQAAQLQAYKTELETLSKADKEFGGDKLNENLAVAKKAMDAFGTPALRELLDVSGLGNHPEVIRAFYRAGKSISVDKFVTGGTQPQTGSTSAASRLYGAK